MGAREHQQEKREAPGLVGSLGASLVRVRLSLNGLLTPKLAEGPDIDA